MKNTVPKKQTRAEAAYVRDMAKTSAMQKIDSGQARILTASELPEPLKRFAARESSQVHIRLPAAARRRLALLSQAKGVPPEVLARKWVEQGLEREAG